MAEAVTPSKRKTQGGDSSKKKKKYRSDGTPIWGKRLVEGPGVWVSCVKGKEKQAVGEVYDLFESIGSELWPLDGPSDQPDDEDKNINLEERLFQELSKLKRPRKDNPQQRFANCPTNTPCVLFISCNPPVDPVELVLQYVKTIKETGVTRTRNVYRVVPISGSAVANIPEIQALCRKVFSNFFTRHPGSKFTYKIELRVRNHTTIPRQTLIQAIAQCVPEEHSVDLNDPKIFILVEVFKSICGVAVVQDYYQWHKFNVMEIASEKVKGDTETVTRLIDKPVTS